MLTDLGCPVLESQVINISKIYILCIFSQGCDASVLIASPNGDAEKDSSDNISLAGDGFDTVIKAKEAVEAQCPGVVSCADILAIATRDVVVLVIKDTETIFSFHLP